MRPLPRTTSGRFASVSSASARRTDPGAGGRLGAGPATVNTDSRAASGDIVSPRTRAGRPR
ncbi:hypothetical protein BCD48_05670 [Pseudofrankia sp. BMG5.36]|nr:hypothetical protein BCD48_05670 [Pseudofrankia sp. BMG5.36]